MISVAMISCSSTPKADLRSEEDLYDMMCLKSSSEADYEKVLKAWSKAINVYSGLEARLTVYVTYKSCEFRQAYLNEYASRLQLDQEKVDILRSAEMEKAEKRFDLIFSAYTPVASWNDFDDDDSIWKLYMTDDTGMRVEPLEIKKLDSDDPLIREFYPYVDDWSVVYHVSFPRLSRKGDVIGASGTIKLVVTGIKGSGEARFTLSPVVEGK